MSSSRPFTRVPTRPFGSSIATRGLRTRPRPVKKADPAVVEKAQNRMRVIESMPFQTYQLALEVVRKDQREKEEAIKQEKERIQENLEKGGKPDSRIMLSLRRQVEYLEVQRDINHPRTKYNFDRGAVDMDVPVYRHLMNEKWRGYRRPLLMERIETMNVVPDVLPFCDPVVDVTVRFQGKNIQPGSILPAATTEREPTFKIIPFTPGTKRCTVVVVDSDIPNFETNSYGYRLHWLVSNIEVSHLQTQALGSGSKPSDTIVPWLPPHGRRGIPYNRYSMFVFEQSKEIDAKALEGKIERDGFILRSFQGKHKLGNPIGAFMFRSKWDPTTAEVMQKYDMPGWDKMFVRSPEL